MKILMHACLNALIVFALVGIAAMIEPALIHFKIRRHCVLAFCSALIVLVALLAGLLMGAFHE